MGAERRRLLRRGDRVGEDRIPIAAFLGDRAVRRGVPLRMVATRANGQPAFGCYLPQGDIARPYGLLVVALRGDQVSAMTWFADSSVFPQFGLPRMLR